MSRILDLAKPFEWEVGLSAEECANRLQGLAKSRSGLFDATSREVKIVQTHDERGYIFSVRLGHHGRGKSTSAKAAGRIIERHGMNQTSIQGDVRTAIVRWIVLLYGGGLVLYLLWTSLSYSNLACVELYFVFLSVIVLLQVITGLADRATLYHLLHDTFYPEKKYDG